MKTILILGDIPPRPYAELRKELERSIGELVVGYQLNVERSEHQYCDALVEGVDGVGLGRRQPDALRSVYAYNCAIDAMEHGVVAVVAWPRPRSVPWSKHWGWLRKLLEGKDVRWYVIEKADSLTGFRFIDEGTI